MVGDAPNDLACARAGGVRCLLVATGRPTYDELEALHPDALRHDLSRRRRDRGPAPLVGAGRAGARAPPAPGPGTE